MKVRSSLHVTPSRKPIQSKIVLPFQLFLAILVSLSFGPNSFAFQNQKSGNSKIEPTHTVKMKYGRVYRGVVKPIKKNGRNTKSILLTLPNGTQMTLTKLQYDSVTKDSKSEIEYWKRLKKTGMTVKDQWNLAVWCKEAKLKEFYKKHAKICVELDPTFEEGRKAAGYVKDRRTGAWLKVNERLYRMGYRKEGNKTVVPSMSWLKDKIIADGKNAREERKKITRLLRKISTSRKIDQKLKAKNELLALNGPEMLDTVVKQFEKSKFKTERWYLLYDLITRIDSPASFRYQLNFYLNQYGNDNFRKDLIRRAKKDPKKREIAISHFQSALSPTFSGGKEKLDQPKQVTARIDRAAEAMRNLEAKSGIPQLINALVITHRKQVTEAPSTSVGSGGVQGYNGGKPKTRIIESTMKSDEALETLKGISGQNFGFDQKRWFDWWVKKNDPGYVDLRRDE